MLTITMLPPGLRQFAAVPFRGALERLERAALIEMNHGVELLREPRREVMAPAFRLRPVNDADGALQARFA